MLIRRVLMCQFLVGLSLFSILFVWFFMKQLKLLNRLLLFVLGLCGFGAAFLLVRSSFYDFMSVYVQRDVTSLFAALVRGLVGAYLIIYLIIPVSWNALKESVSKYRF